MKTSLSKPFKNALIVVLMAAIWVLFAPAQFGGTATYVIVAGASMEPALQQGDLVIARTTSTYEVGDITAYQHPKVGPIIHRIIERKGPYYTLKGDNNDWIDSYEPVNADILGKSWLHIPGAAEKLLWLRSPVGLSLLSLSIGIMFLITITNDTEHQKERDKQGVDLFTKWFRQTQSLRLGEWVFPLGILLFASVLLGAFAFTKPVLRTVPDDIQYEHQGAFSYRAPAMPSLYSGSEIQTGEAIFHDLVDTIDLSYNYTLETKARSDVVGSSHMSLRISEPNGWNRQYLLIPETSFDGRNFTTQTTIDLEQINRYLDWVQAQTALERRSFDINIIVDTQVQGTLDNQPFSDQFSTTLGFKLDELQFYLSEKSPLGEDVDPLNPIEIGDIPRQSMIENTLSILGLEIAVHQARQIAWITGGVSLALIALIMAPALIVSMRSESERIKLTHNDRLLEVDEIPLEGDLEWIRLNSIDDLIKLSESTGGLIMHVREGEDHTYLLMDGDIGYRLTLHDPNGTDQLLETDDNADQRSGGE